MIQYIDDCVLKDYETFVSSGKQYSEDASHIDQIMEHFRQRTTKLNQNIHQISNSIVEINTAIKDSTGGVTSSAEETTALAANFTNISDEASTNHEIATALKDVTTRFIIR